MDDTTDVKEVGKQLMAFDLGLHRLVERDGANNDRTISRLVVGVHGRRSQGYEWVYPLNELADEDSGTFFFRWDFNKCAVDSGRLLMGELKKVKEDLDESIESILVVGHSLGGVLVATIAAEWDIQIRTELHVVAAPLASMDRSNCEQALPDRLPLGVSIYQWRTQKELDNAFKNAPFDPQDVEIPGSVVATLPDTYKGNRLGHNWSVSYVADRLRQSLDSEE